MPAEAAGRRFYDPQEAEERLRERLEAVRRARGRADGRETS